MGNGMVASSSLTAGGVTVLCPSGLSKTLYQLLSVGSKIVSMIRKYHNHKLQTNPWYREEEPHKNHKTPGRQSKAILSLFPIKMIAKLEWTQSNTQPNVEQLQNSTMGVTINSESTTTEPPP